MRPVPLSSQSHPVGMSAGSPFGHDGAFPARSHFRNPIASSTVHAPLSSRAISPITSRSAAPGRTTTRAPSGQCGASMIMLARRSAACLIASRTIRAVPPESLMAWHRRSPPSDGFSGHTVYWFMSLPHLGVENGHDRKEDGGHAIMLPRADLPAEKRIRHDRRSLLPRHPHCRPVRLA